MNENSYEGMSVDLKNDILLAFNLFKNEKNKISKLKLRTLLFSFIMYKSGSGEINQFIDEQTSEDQEFFTYDEVCRMINFKLRSAKEKESDELFGFIASNKNDTYLSEKELAKAYKTFELEANDKDIKEMMRYILGDSNESSGNIKVSKEQFTKFYSDTK